MDPMELVAVSSLMGLQQRVFQPVFLSLPLSTATFLATSEEH